MNILENICEHTWKSSCILQVQDGGESSDGSGIGLYKDDESCVIWFNRSNSELVAGLLYQQHPAELFWACFPAYGSCPSYGMVLGFSAWLIRRFYLHLNCQVCIHLRSGSLPKCRTPLLASLTPPLCSLFMFRELVLELGWCNSLNHGPLVLWDPFTFNW